MADYINPSSAPAAVGPYSVAVKTGDGFLFLSGQIPLDPKTGEIRGLTVAEQTKTVLENIRGILADCGCFMTNVVKCVIYTTDLSQFSALNEAYAEAFGNHKPVRTTVGVAALPKGALVEIEVTAYRA
jgi:2-iminobutanoate/2-iminopropanoate deaminase